MAETWFAPPSRSTDAELDRELSLVARSPIVDTLLVSVAGMFAILDRNRQLLTMNRTFLSVLGLDEATDVLGLRPGEALDCVHAHEEAHGCGTARACATCGAVQAVLEAQRTGEPAERTCMLALRDRRTTRDMVARVRVSPLEIADETFYQLFLQDVTWAHRLAGLERIFLHDIGNLLQGLKLATDMMAVEGDPRESRTLGRQARRLVEHLGREVALQRAVMFDGDLTAGSSLEQVSLAHVQAELGKVFQIHPAARGRHLAIGRDDWNTWIRTDAWILVRVLSNLVLNALEASAPGERVEVRTRAEPAAVVFSVHNRGTIPVAVRPRIFQKHFSTRAERGRGLGTYSAKLLTETLLGGTVAFTSDPERGTTFRVRVPR